MSLRIPATAGSISLAYVVDRRVAVLVAVCIALQTLVEYQRARSNARDRRALIARLDLSDRAVAERVLDSLDRPHWSSRTQWPSQTAAELGPSESTPVDGEVAPVSLPPGDEDTSSTSSAPPQTPGPTPDDEIRILVGAGTW